MLLAIFMQRVSSVQLVVRVFQNDQRRRGSIVASLVLSTGYISGGIVDAIPDSKSSKSAFEAECGMCGDGGSKSDLEQSDVACDVTLRNLIPSHSRKLKLVKSSPYIANQLCG